MAEYLENIKLAEYTLENLSSEIYPNLYKVFHGKGNLVNKLRILLEYIRQYGALDPAQTGGGYYTSVSIRQLTAEGGGSVNTWGGMLAQLSGWGLIQKSLPIAGTPAGNKAIQQREIQKRRRGLDRNKSYALIMWYHVPAWTAEVLQTAEELAEKYIPAGTCTRARARDVYGEDMAASMYPDGRQGIASITQRIRDGIDRAVKDRIRNKGYFYPNEIITDVRKQRIYHKGQEIRKDHIRRVFTGYLPKVAEDLKLRHGRPTAEELIRYGIPAERSRTWIYRPTEEDGGT